MESHRNRLTIADLAKVVFCTNLQPSEDPSPENVRSTVAYRLRQHADSLDKSAEEVAGRYGEDPDIASARMRWSRAVVATAYATRTQRPGLGERAWGPAGPSGISTPC